MEKNALRLPAGFESYQEARQAGFLRMKQLKESGARVIGLFCSYVPIELIYAAGAVPVGPCASSEEPIAAAEANLSPKSVSADQGQGYGSALDGYLSLLLFLRPGGGRDHL